MVFDANIGQYVFNGIAIGSGYVLLAMGLNLVFGILDIADFAQGNLYMLSTYLLFLFAVTMGLPYVVAAVAAIVLVGLLGVGYYYTVYRPLIDEPPITTFLAAFGLFAVIEGTVFLVWGPGYRNIPSPVPGQLQIVGVFVTHDRLLAIVATVLVVLFTFWLLQRTRVGLSIRAVAQNRLKASLLGLSTDRTYALTFLIASVLSATAGVVVGSIFTVTPFIGLEAILKGFIVAIFGGLGSVRGAVVAGYLLGLSESFSVLFFSAEIANNIGFAILFLVLIFHTEGLFGHEEALS